jgi:hypothetical protein
LILGDVFDGEGNHLKAQEFSTGWRIDIAGARFITNNVIGQDLIEISTHRMIRGEDVAREFYGLINDGLVLVRLEDGKGGILRNSYQARHWTIGPTPPRREPGEWEVSLRSDNAVEVLRALVWIGGEHCYPCDEDSTSRDGEPLKIRSKYVNQVRAMPGVQCRLKELLRSKNKWIREAAKLAIKPADDTTVLDR